MSVPLSQTYGKQKTPPKTSTELRLTVSRVTAIWPRKIYVQWYLRNSSAATGYTFKVYRSGSAEGPWTQVSGDIVDIYFFLDDSFSAPNDRTEPGLFSLKRTIYYKVEVTHALDGTLSVIKKLEPGLDRRRQGIVRKLRRDASVALRKGSGTEVAIFKRRWWGEECTCKAKTGQVVRAHCHICHGTGIVHGYWDPVYGFATRSSQPVVVQTASAGNVEIHKIRVKMLDIPEVTRYDFLVFLRDDKRYIIDDVVSTEIHTVNVHQELEVSELARSSREYDLVADDWHTPEWF